MSKRDWKEDRRRRRDVRAFEAWRRAVVAQDAAARTRHREGPGIDTDLLVLLRRLQAGDTVRFCAVPGTTTVFHTPFGRGGFANPAAFQTAFSSGWIAQAWLGEPYRLTEAGRATLLALES